jgi:hypothetical protein
MEGFTPVMHGFLLVTNLWVNMQYGYTTTTTENRNQIQEEMYEEV